MIDYKKIIKNQNIRFNILKFTEFIPDKEMIKLQYILKTGRRLNLNKPKRFTEKIQHYKLKYRNSLMTQCVDKYQVRNYVKSKGLEDILIPIYGIYDNAEKINFNNLPNKFVLKTTNGSHTNILCKDKNTIKIEEVKKTLNEWLKDKSPKLGREWAYYNIKPNIICEKYIEDKKNREIMDYKFFCFEGKVKYLWVDVDRHTNHKRNLYNSNWDNLEIKIEVPSAGDIEKPKQLKKMIEIAEKLSEDFPHARIDLYNIDGEIYFGEITFYTLSGYINFKPDKFDFILGEEFDIEKIGNGDNDEKNTFIGK